MTSTVFLARYHFV